MADDIAISVHGISKRYLIGHQSAAQETFREMLGRQARRAARSLADLSRGDQIVRGNTVEEFWALRDLSFSVPRGEVLGVIGSNGAGKSTLLKILSRITEPTAGRVVMNGRVSSLLEVGTGFHPELTGRENVFLNGAILGMTRSEIAVQFDEIVDFAEIERFLDTPVKRYSSGMYVRLAFAVAAHLQPEILIIDEVLAVGDIAFQKKCLGKIQNVAGAGRTVLFVSHNLPTVVDLTSRAILLDGGKLAAIGPSAAVVTDFLRRNRDKGGGANVSAYRRTHRMDGFADIVSITVGGAPAGAAAIEYGEDIIVEVGLDVKQTLRHVTINCVIYTNQLQPLTTLCSEDMGASFDLDPGASIIRCVAKAPPLAPGDYYLEIGVQQAGGALAWDVIQLTPGFSVHRSAVVLNRPDRPGAMLTRDCTWTLSAGQISSRE